VNWRAAGCLLLGMAIFVGIGLLGMAVAFRTEPGCPSRLEWADPGSSTRIPSNRTYLAEGTPAPSPAFSVEGPAIDIGSTFFGLTTRRVLGPPGSSPSTAAADRPETVALDCADGTFQTYQWDGVSRTPPPSDGG
jgi:uncharacterized membrane protein YedE/YeeE